MAAIASRWFRRKASQRLAGSGSLGARFIQREMVLSERSKPRMSSSPWILGAPQVGLSATIRKISSRTSFGVGLLPTSVRTLEISLQSPDGGWKKTNAEGGSRADLSDGR